jgi:cell division protein FtsL
MKDAVRRFKETVENRSVAVTKGRWRRYVSVFVLVVMIIVTACFQVWQRVEVLDLVQKEGQLRQQNAMLVDESRKLHAEIAQLSTPTRIQNFAEDSLGMLPISGERLFTLVPRQEPIAPKPDDIELVFHSIKRVTENLPGISSTSATARALDSIIFDTSTPSGTR